MRLWQDATRLAGVASMGTLRLSQLTPAWCMDVFCRTLNVPSEHLKPKVGPGASMCRLKIGLKFYVCACLGNISTMPW
jgi:hypothetical protein